jgi:tRNA(Ile)-lysidine synthase
MTLVSKLDRFLQTQQPGADGILVAVSGGPDSVALLRGLREAGPALPLVAAHLNHRLRGEESNADASFVQELCGTLGLKCCYDHCDVRARAEEEGNNLEATARRIRYDWLEKVASEQGLHWVATGHTADDQAETVLHRLLRGTGLRGLRGIAAQRPLSPDVTLIRPLLHVTRAEVMEFLQTRNQDFCTDRTNLDLTLTRNRIRHELLPFLAANYNPEIARVLAQVAEQADEAYGAMEAEAARLLAQAERPRAGALLIFDRRHLAEAPRDRVREMFHLVWIREGWPTGQIDFDAWDRLARVACGDLAAVDLPGGISARLRERVVQLGRSS